MGLGKNWFGRCIWQGLRRKERKYRNAAKPLRIEPLERRKLLAADVAIADFTSDGSDLLVEYDVTGLAVDAFDIGVYRSSDGTTLDALLTTCRVSDSSDRQIGTGYTATIPAAFSDIEQDYFLVAAIDSNLEITEDSESNNNLVFQGGTFVSTGDIVQVHGTPNADAVDIIVGTNIEVELNDISEFYLPANVSSLHIRTHNEGDAVTGDCNMTASVVVFGGAGNDQITGGAGDDILCGGLGDDVLYGEEGDDEIYGQDGIDRLYGGANGYGGGSGDMLDGGLGDDILYGDEGLGDGYGGDADTLYGGGGDDTLFGEDGDDHLDAGNDNDTVYGGRGDDVIYGRDGVDTLYGGVNDYGGDGDILDGGNGDDILYGDNSFGDGFGGDADTLIGGDGDDRLYGEDGADELDAGAGDDMVYGGLSDDVLYGKDGDDDLYGQGGDDTIFGGVSGEGDTLHGGDGDDVLYGDEGLGDGHGGDTDTLNGGDGNDTLYGEDGLDQLDGGDGSDTLFGGLGNDVLYGKGGADYLYGQDGDDTLYGGVNEYGGSYGGGYGDTLDGGAGDDTLYGDDGLGSGYGGDADTLTGGAGDDTLYGENGDDNLDGGLGIDSLDGGGQAGDAIEDRPTITGFSVIEDGSALEFSGTVVDDGDVEGLTIVFGGLLTGETATVNTDGYFVLVIELPSGAYGTVSASITDEEDLTSELALLTI